MHYKQVFNNLHLNQLTLRAESLYVDDLLILVVEAGVYLIELDLGSTDGLWC